MAVLGEKPMAIDTLLTFNAARCNPPLPDQEVQAIAASAASYEFAPWLLNPMGWVADPQLKPNERLVLLALAEYFNPRGECWPSMRRLQHDTGLRLEAIKRAIDGLVRAGKLTVERGDVRKSNRYRLTI
jgi:DNA-binding MarR family transcriptional regulator